LKTIADNIRQLLSELPPGVELVAAAKGAPPEAVLEAIGAGVEIIGESYVQEAETAYQAIACPPSPPNSDRRGNKTQWHLIGHLQKNKVKKAVALFDMIESLDSLEIAREIDKQCALIGKVMPVLIEVNSGREAQKSGVFPEGVEQLVKEIVSLQNLKLMGLMTVGPYSGNPEDYRPYFAATRQLFDKLNELNELNKLNEHNELKYLSMGMSDSYKAAIEEGANLVRIGTKIFGERQ